VADLWAWLDADRFSTVELVLAIVLGRVGWELIRRAFGSRARHVRRTNLSDPTPTVGGHGRGDSPRGGSEGDTR
jgi:hypothetical protein